MKHLSKTEQEKIINQITNALVEYAIYQETLNFPSGAAFHKHVSTRFLHEPKEGNGLDEYFESLYVRNRRSEEEIRAKVPGKLIIAQVCLRRKYRGYGIFTRVVKNVSHRTRISIESPNKIMRKICEDNNFEIETWKTI